ncbi:heterokaryon incompatibility protein-domain-containing protein [Stachybotrys elegans]|uniref:Heterokaryon incompatibility protein-domain-containing protein n=1 Tax=Stachybotrys elegans TaxID=80388 RepID=A0A8K0WQ18_9HYPO|nr:heterokaryon incompatibility protein-domain-containing protein [Stachybotrys elegans]
MSSPTPYPYDPIDASRGQIRLFEILPGNSTDPINVVMSTVTLWVGSTTPYEALSYPWGPKDLLFPITLRSGYGIGQVLIRRNLWTILRTLRSTADSRIFWTDAICIDQANEKEIAEHVLEMHRVYALADRVIIWLDSGSANMNSLVQQAMDTLLSIQQHVEVDWKTGSTTPRPSNEFSAGDVSHGAAPSGGIDLGSITQSQWLAIDRLMNVEWFNRLWTVQEARLASPRSICLCGAKTVLWRHLLNALLILRLQPCPPAVRMRAKYLTDIFNPNTQWSLLKLCEFTSRQGCEDPRDHVYALLGMLPAEQAWLPLKVDKGITLDEVFVRLAETFIKGNWLEFLSLCRPVTTVRSLRPSWAPNPLLPRDTEEFYLPGCGVPTRGEATVIDGKILQIAVVQCGVVSSVIYRSETPMALPEAIKGIISMLYDEVFDDNYVSGCSAIEALCGTMLAKDFSTLIEPPDPQLPPLSSCVDILRIIWEYRDRENRDVLLSQALQQMLDSTNFLLGFSYACKGRAVVRMSNGYLGIAPSAVRVGDILYNVLGHDAPLLLRPAEDDKLQVVGDCFAYGLMNSEALLGPFPSHMEKVVHPSGDRTQRRTYRDKNSGEVTLVDPRVISYGIFHRLHHIGVPDLVTREELQSIGVDVQFRYLI